MAGRIGGDCTLEVNGMVPVLGTDCTVKPSGKNREPVESMAQDGRLRYTEREMPGTISVTVLLDPDQDVHTLIDLAEGNINLTMGNGETYRGTGMTRIGEVPELDAVAGTVPLVFSGIVRRVG